MARVTVEDCLDKVENRFQLVLIAAKRAHQLNSGGYRTTLDAGKDKPTVLALREIEADLIDARAWQPLKLIQIYSLPYLNNLLPLLLP